MWLLKFSVTGREWIYSSDTDAHNHVNSHVLRRITYWTYQTSHTYNTLSVLFSNLLPSSRVSPRSAHHWQHYYMKTNIKGIMLFNIIVNVPHLSTAGVEVSKLGMINFPLISRSLDPVCFNISPLYQIISSHQFHQLSYYILHFKQKLCKYHVGSYVTLKAPVSEKCISRAPHWANWRTTSQQQTTGILYYQESQKKQY